MPVPSHPPAISYWAKEKLPKMESRALTSDNQKQHFSISMRRVIPISVRSVVLCKIGSGGAPACPLTRDLLQAHVHVCLQDRVLKTDNTRRVIGRAGSFGIHPAWLGIQSAIPRRLKPSRATLTVC